MESSDEEEEQDQPRKKKRATKKAPPQQDSPAGPRGQAWIREGGEDDEPLNFLDPSVTQRVSGKYSFIYDPCYTCFLHGFILLLSWPWPKISPDKISPTPATFLYIAKGRHTM